MASELTKIENKIYRATSKFCGHIYSDTAWQHVRELVQIIENVEGVNDVSVGAGTYYNYLSTANPDKPAYRDYQITISTDFGEIEGYIRCHSAGDVDDPFSRYDMTISIWHEKMKKVIITPEQLYEISRRLKNSINEENNITIGAKASENSIGSFTKAATSPEFNKQLANAQTVAPDVNVVISGPGENDSKPTEVIAKADDETITQALQKANPNNIQSGGKVEIQEGKTYTKKAVEEARLRKMYAEGVKYTKKSLNETFLLESKLEDLMGKNVSTVIDAFKAIGGDPQSLKGEWDVASAIMKAYNNASPEQQEIFTKIINSGE